jgi:spoIIIJ-associated protein
MAQDHDMADSGRGVDFDAASKVGTEEITVLLERMGLDVGCNFVGREEDRLNYDITGPDAHVFSQDGPTLDALQYLAYVLVGRRLGERYSICIDAEGYRERRRQELTEYALRTAEEAVLDPLRPHERRIVHLALRGRDDVETYSEGEEPFRRIIISPKD